jgi:hypothetical protein
MFAKDMKEEIKKQKNRKGKMKKKIENKKRARGSHFSPSRDVAQAHYRLILKGYIFSSPPTLTGGAHLSAPVRIPGRAREHPWPSILATP